MKNLDDVSPFYVMEVLERSNEIEDEIRRGIKKPYDSVIHLEIGEPDFPSLPCIKEAAIRAIEEGDEKYTHSLGDPELRNAVVRKFEKKYGVSVNSECVIAGSGTSPLLLAVCMLLFKEGDEIIMARPYYAAYPNFIRSLGAVPVFVDTKPEEGFRLNPEDVRRAVTPKTKAILTNSPANPTGAILSPDDLKAVAEISEETGIPIIADEIYQGIAYGDEKEHTILEFTKNAFVLNGFSKYYCMTGWRLGYMVVPESYVRPIQKLMQNYFISVNAFVQKAGIAALESPDEEYRSMIETYNERRICLVSRLRKAGFVVPVDPKGAFYVLADARNYTDDSVAFASKILEETGVACTPGLDFGAEGYIRFSYANSRENIEKAMDRLEKWLKDQPRKDA
ncbi:MAG: pyridoxal phosphate-dependent aminotransferase [Methanosarcinaceae archaeon]|nr:pyridoxal phosphate-dependent aminotransferase [Methanosarcinaceae archaeon]